MKKIFVIVSLLVASSLQLWAQDYPKPEPRDYPFADGSDTSRGVYGVDDRKEVGDKSWVKDYARATAVLVKKSDIVGNKLYAPTLRKNLSQFYGTSKFHENVKFLDQPIAAYCTGFLIAPDIMVTAGHCIETMEQANEYVWLFDYTSNNNFDPQKGYMTIDKKNIYEVKEVMDAWLYSGNVQTNSGDVFYADYDYSFLKLDRESERSPYRFRTGGDVKLFTNMYTIGCPTGLPLKLTDNAYVLDTDKKEWFKTNIDGFPGNSGGPVFDELGYIEGIHVRGSRTYSEIEEAWKGDYMYDETCRCIKTVTWKSALTAENEDEMIIGSQEHRILFNKLPEVRYEALYNNINYAIRTKDNNRLDYWSVYTWILDNDYTVKRGRLEIVAAKENNLAALEKLVSISGEANMVDEDGRSLLFHAIKNNNAEMYTYLLKKGISPNKPDNAGVSPLVYALSIYKTEMATKLINSGAKVNDYPSSLSSPLHYAVSQDDMEMVQLLLRKGASLSAEDYNGVTPYKLAKKLKHKEVKKYLKKAKKGKL
jgi:V8-like Glu-specific endopeptidase